MLTIFIGLMISLATSSIIVFAQERMPHRFGMISGMFFGVAFDIAGRGAVRGCVAEHTCIAFVHRVCAFLLAIGLLTLLAKLMSAGRRGVRFPTLINASLAIVTSHGLCVPGFLETINLNN